MNNSERILFMIGASYVAGAEITNLNLARDLHQQGYQILVIVSGWNDGDFVKRLRQYNIPYTSIKLGYVYLTKPSWTLDTLIHYPKAITRLRQILKDFKPSWIFHSSYRSFIMGYPLFKNYKNIYREHDDPNITRMTLWLYQLLNKKINLFICPSLMVKQKLIELGVHNQKINIIASPVDPEFIDQHKMAYNPAKIKAVGIIGQIIPRKGFDFLFKELEKVKSNFNLMIYGDDSGPYAQALKQSITEPLKSKVQWMGYVNDRTEIYQNLDIVLFPSLSESFGRIIIEAAAFEIPSITSDIDCFNEIITNGETGLIFKLSDKSELGLLLEKLLSDNELRQRIGKNAKEHVLSKFTSAICTDNFKRCLNFKS